VALRPLLDLGSGGHATTGASLAFTSRRAKKICSYSEATRPATTKKTQKKQKNIHFKIKCRILAAVLPVLQRRPFSDRGLEPSTGPDFDTQRALRERLVGVKICGPFGRVRAQILTPSGHLGRGLWVSKSVALLAEYGPRF